MKAGFPELVDKVAIVTGAGQGVGEGIALSLGQHGVKVAAMGRTLSKVEATCREIESRGGVALPIEGNVKVSGDLAGCVDRVVDVFGGIQILVNNAQEVHLAPLIGLSDEQVEAAWESGPFATFRMMKLCYPHLKGDGCIVNLGSTAARLWDPTTYGGYAAAKEAILAFTRVAATEWGPDGIRANAILPYAKSPAIDTWTQTSPEEAAAMAAGVPLQRIGECEEDIGEFVAMLCSDASSYVSGQSIALDGALAYMP